MEHRAVIYVRPGSRAHRWRDDCMARCQAEGLEVVEVTDDPGAARAAREQGRVDHVVTAQPEHAQDVYPELSIGRLPRPRHGAIGVVVAPLAWILHRAREYPAAVAATAVSVAGLVMLPLVMPSDRFDATSEPPPPAAYASPPRVPVQPAPTSRTPAAASVLPAPPEPPGASSVAAPAAPTSPVPGPAVQPPPVELPGPEPPPVDAPLVDATVPPVQTPDLPGLPTLPPVTTDGDGEEGDGEEDRPCLEVETPAVDLELCVDQPNG